MTDRKNSVRFYMEHQAVTKVTHESSRDSIPNRTTLPRIAPPRCPAPVFSEEYHYYRYAFLGHCPPWRTMPHSRRCFRRSWRRAWRPKYLMFRYDRYEGGICQGTVRKKKSFLTNRLFCQGVFDYFERIFVKIFQFSFPRRLYSQKLIGEQLLLLWLFYGR